MLRLPTNLGVRPLTTGRPRGHVCVCVCVGCVSDPRMVINCLLPGPLQQTPAFPRIISLITMPADFSSQLIFLPFVSNSNTLPFSRDFRERSSQCPFGGVVGGGGRRGGGSVPRG